MFVHSFMFTLLQLPLTPHPHRLFHTHKHTGTYTHRHHHTIITHNIWNKHADSRPVTMSHRLTPSTHPQTLLTHLFWLSFSVLGWLVLARQPLNKDEREEEKKKKKDRGRGRRDNLKSHPSPSRIKKKNACLSSLTFLYEACVFSTSNFPIRMFGIMKNTLICSDLCDFIDSGIYLRKCVGEFAAWINRFPCLRAASICQ